MSRYYKWFDEISELEYQYDCILYQIHDEYMHESLYYHLYDKITYLESLFEDIFEYSVESKQDDKAKKIVTYLNCYLRIFIRRYQCS